MKAVFSNECDIEDKESNYFEFRINIDEITDDLALIINDFAEAEEKEDSIYLWDSQIADLKRLLGIWTNICSFVVTECPIC